MSEAPRTAEADWYGQSGLDGRHEWEIVWQFEYIGNRQGESDIAVKRDALLLAAALLCTPLAYQGVLIEEDHREASAISTDLRFAPVGASLEPHVRMRQDDLAVLMNAMLRRYLTKLVAAILRPRLPRSLLHAASPMPPKGRLIRCTVPGLSHVTGLDFYVS